MERQNQIALVCCALAAGLAAIFMASRVGLPDNGPALAAVIRALVLTVGAATLPALLPRGRAGRDLAPGAMAALAIPAALALFYGLSWVPGGFWIVAALAAAGLARSLPAARPLGGLARPLGWAVVLAVLTLLLAIYALPRSHPPFAAEQAVSRHLFIDGYYHMAVSQMIRGFGVATAGFDGMTADRYHYGLDFLIARLSLLAECDIPFFFPALMHLTILPLLVRALVSVGSDATDGPVLPLTAAVVAGIVLYASITNDIIFVSASHLASILLVVATFPLMLWIAEHPRRRGGEAPWWAWAAVLALLLLNWGFKVSAGMMLAVAFGWLILRSGRSLLGIVAAGAVVGLVSLFGLSQFANSGDHATVMKLSFFSYYWADEVRVWKRPLFFLIYSAFPLVFVAARLFEEGATTSKGLMHALRQRRIVDAETVAWLCLAGYVPGLLLFTPDLVWIYFYDLPAWLALPLVAGRIVRAPMSPRPDRGRVSAAALLALVLLAPTFEVMGAMLMKRAGRFVAEVMETHAGLSGKTLPPRNALAERAETAFAALSAPGAAWATITAPKQTPATSARIQEIARRHRAEYGLRAALYIPPTNTAFWADRVDNFVLTAMLVPALTGVPLIDGRPPLPFHRSYGYGFALVEPRTDDVPLTDQQVCARAARFGLGPVYRVDSLSDLAANRLLTCAQAH